MDTENTIPASPNFSGSIPQHYDQYLGPMFFEPYAIEISKRINASSVLLALEIGSATGRLFKNKNRTGGKGIRL